MRESESASPASLTTDSAVSPTVSRIAALTRCHTVSERIASR
nr:MAG TPA: hypothetical protein [Caudoviricetes sp.]